MGSLNSTRRVILAGFSVFVLLVLATLAIASRPTRDGLSGSGANVGSAPGQAVEPTWPPPPTPISDQQARAIATESARLYGPPEDGRPGSVHVDRARPSIENLSSMPRIFIATVEGKGSGVRLWTDVLGIYTPLELRIEQMLVDEFEPPAGFQYVAYGGTTADGDSEKVEGIHPEIEVGQRYIFYTLPLLMDDGKRDPRYMALNYAMPIDAQNEVEDIAEGGKRIKIPLTEAIARIELGAAKTRWSPESR